MNENNRLDRLPRLGYDSAVQKQCFISYHRLWDCKYIGSALSAFQDRKKIPFSLESNFGINCCWLRPTTLEILELEQVCRHKVQEIFFGKEHLVKNWLISTLDRVIYFKGTLF
jgi:hypothetical protein